MVILSLTVSTHTDISKGTFFTWCSGNKVNPAHCAPSLAQPLTIPAVQGRGRGFLCQHKDSIPSTMHPETLPTWQHHQSLQPWLKPSWSFWLFISCCHSFLTCGAEVTMLTHFSGLQATVFPSSPTQQGRSWSAFPAGNAAAGLQRWATRIKHQFSHFCQNDTRSENERFQAACPRRFQVSCSLSGVPRVFSLQCLRLYQLCGQALPLQCASSHQCVVKIEWNSSSVLSLKKALLIHLATNNDCINFVVDLHGKLVHQA